MKNILILLLILSTSGCASLIKDMPQYSTKEVRQKYVDEHPETPNEVKESILKGTITIGMTKDQVIASWGKPADIHRTVSNDYDNEQWVYTSTFLYFEDDVLKTIQDY